MIPIDYKKNLEYNCYVIMQLDGEYILIDDKFNCKKKMLYSRPINTSKLISLIFEMRQKLIKQSIIYNL